MTLSRVKVWVDGNVLTALDLNNEFNNILTNPTALISPMSGTLNMNLNQVSNLVVEKLASNPAVVTQGRLYFNTAANRLVTGVITSGSTDYVFVGPQVLSRVISLSGSIASNVATFTAGVYQLQNGPGWDNIVVVSTETLTINTQLAGPIRAGRDQAAAFASTDVHFYAYGDFIGSTALGGICSSQPPPLGPKAGNYWTYLCSAKYNVVASGVSAASAVRGNSVIYNVPAGNLTTAAGVVSLETLVNTNTLVPSIATKQTINVAGLRVQANTTVNAQAEHTFNVDPGGNPLITWRTNQINTSSGALTNPINGIIELHVPTSVAPRFYYAHSFVGGSGTSASMQLDLVKYTVANGDN